MYLSKLTDHKSAIIFIRQLLLVIGLSDRQHRVENEHSELIDKI